MQAKKFLDYHDRFGIAGFLRPWVGGPQPQMSHLIHKEESRSYWPGIARNIKFISVRPFDSLDFSSSSQWSIPSKQTRVLYANKKYGELTMMGPIPVFVDQGFQFSAVFFDPNIFPSMRLQSWSPLLDSKSSIQELIEDAKKTYQFLFQLRSFEPVELLYLLKTSWEKSSLKDCSYEIYIPKESKFNIS